LRTPGLLFPIGASSAKIIKTKIPVYTRIYQDIPGYTRIYQDIPGYTRIYQEIPG
jgi:hypothetical protein